MNTRCNEFISWAKDKGWDITFKSESGLELDDSIISRFNGIPQGYIEFLKIVFLPLRILAQIPVQWSLYYRLNQLHKRNSLHLQTPYKSLNLAGFSMVTATQ